MRVPESIRNSVLFIGAKKDLPEWEWIGTGYLIGIPGYPNVLRHTVEREGRRIQAETYYQFTLLATARHIAEELEGRDFALRANKVNGSIAIIEGHADQQWWYHPTERKYVDAAVTIFLPPNLGDLDIHWVRIDDFVDQEKIAASNLGAGDEVFLAGLFTEVQETTRNIPIVRIGNLAMMPGEKIPFKDGKLIEAYLVESRSIGGLSGSPVFIRETITVNAGKRFLPGFALNAANDPTPESSGVRSLTLTGLGSIYFLGSMIGHWDAPIGFKITEKEAVNMGVAPIVPAHKIKEIITQPELMEMVKKLHEELEANKHSNAVEDFAPSKTQPFTKEDFEAALKKASRKIEPKKK